MQGIPQPVKNVTVWPHYNWPPHSGIGPVIIPVIEGAGGTYSVGTLTTNIFYNLNLEGADANPALHLGGQYTAAVTYESGQTAFTPWMTCLNASSNPKFGRTKSVFDPKADTPSVVPAGQSDEVDQDDLIHLGDLVDIGVVEFSKPKIVLARQVIEGAAGYQCATRIGTPHKMGVVITDPDGKFSPGMKRLSVGAKYESNGDLFSMQNLTCVSAGSVAILLQTFP